MKIKRVCIQIGIQHSAEGLFLAYPRHMHSEIFEKSNYYPPNTHPFEHIPVPKQWLDDSWKYFGIDCCSYDNEKFIRLLNITGI